MNGDTPTSWLIWRPMPRICKGNTYFCRMFKRFPLLLLFPLIYVLLDIWIRWELLGYYKPKQLTAYGLSLIAALSIYFFSVYCLQRLRRRKWAYWPLLILYTVYIVVAVIASYLFFVFNGFYPNYYTFEYFKNEPLSAFVLLKDSVNLTDMLLFSIGFSGLLWYFRKITNETNRFNTRLSFSLTGLLALTGLILGSGFIKKYDQCLIVDTNFSSAIIRHVIDYDPNPSFKGKGLQARTPIDLPKVGKPKPFNVLVILCESLRNQNLGPYGYERPTTPHLDQFQKENSNNLFVFEKPYSVSTTTMLAVPGVLTGTGAYQEPEVFYSQPFIWDYAKMLNYHTFFLSSHTMKWYRFDRFYANAQLDYTWNKETSGKPFFNDLGVDDKHTINAFKQHVLQKKDDPFFGVVQLNATHYPYRIPKKYQKWSGTFVDEYDNSIFYQDALLGELFASLKDSGLLENTVILLTSDHGESLKDHNNIGHVDSYYIETISVPLLLYVPQKIAGTLPQATIRENCKRAVSTIDIAPTIVDLLDLEEEPSLSNIRKEFTGFSLFKPVPKDRCILTMNNSKIARFKVGLSILQNDLHYIHRMNIVPNRAEVYHVGRDPKEANDLAPFIQRKRLASMFRYMKQFPITEKYLPKGE
jgi:glucan phosphoethanolaminetransferase (alkaline phosphatase superfamily)